MPSLSELPQDNRSMMVGLVAYRLLSQFQDGYWLAIREADITSNGDAAPVYVINIDA